MMERVKQLPCMSFNIYTLLYNKVTRIFRYSLAGLNITHRGYETFVEICVPPEPSVLSDLLASSVVSFGEQTFLITTKSPLAPSSPSYMPCVRVESSLPTF